MLLSAKFFVSIFWITEICLFKILSESIVLFKIALHSFFGDKCKSLEVDYTVSG